MFGRRILIVVGITVGLAASAWGQTFSVLYNFAGGTADGASPYGSLTAVGSTLFGMTSAGGTGDYGTIFSFNTVNNAESVVHDFGDSLTDGVDPQGSLLQSSTSNSTLYGMTLGGGDGSGVIFSFDTGVLRPENVPT